MAAAAPAYANPYLDPVTGLPKGGTATPWVGTQAQVDDSVANHVAALTSQDSKMNQMARTEGLKLANSRGMLNSSMGIGAAQDAVIRNALPIAQQDATQAFQKNQLARGFEYGMEDKSRANAFTSGERIGTEGWQTSEAEAGRNWATGERLGTQQFTTGERLGTQQFTTGERLGAQAFQGTQAELNRALEQLLQKNQITNEQFQQLRSLNTQTDIANAANQLQLTLQGNEQTFQHGENVAARTWQTVENNAQRGWQGDENAMNRDLEELLQNNQITSAERMGFAQIASTEGIEAAGRALQLKLQTNALASAETLTRLDIASNETIARLSRDLQDRIATMNVKSTDKAAATQAVVNFSAQYNARVADINANTSMSAGARTTALTAAKNWLSTTLNLTEQLYNVDLTWGNTPATTTPAAGTFTPNPGNPAAAVATQAAAQHVTFGNPGFRNGQWHVTRNGVDMVFNPDAYLQGRGYVAL